MGRDGEPSRWPGPLCARATGGARGLARELRAGPRRVSTRTDLVQGPLKGHLQHALGLLHPERSGTRGHPSGGGGLAAEPPTPRSR